MNQDMWPVHMNSQPQMGCLKLLLRKIMNMLRFLEDGLLEVLI